MNHDIQGTLENTKCPEIIKIISLGKRTGRLFISSASDSGSIYFSDGRIIHARCSNIEGTKAIYELAAWSSGSYKFFINETSDLATVSLSTDEILNETEKRIRQMEKISSLIPSANTVFKLDPDVKEKEIILKSIQWKTISCIDGHKSISQIAQSIGVTDSDAMKVFYSLLRQGIIKESDEKSSPSSHKSSTLPNTEFVSSLKKNLVMAIGPIAPLIIYETASETGIDLLSDEITHRAILIETLHSRIPDEKAALDFLNQMTEWLKLGEIKS